ncbi:MULTISPECIES: acyl-CoA dehydrogenase family protein [unclassified Sphingomonas]|uniref:acyl-CoA dehydrogenase family protein n=1 Tax=unclassified Sphingomonas TaxID=196159 RepID=UPI0006FDA2F6|nr:MULTISPECIES: acyl-CoA dehydrogenase family protein [unclassified Sphingomonas]KQX18618.1 acyl-CoA dehydrogenase [Sphingomonas sp. Root1294]KQY72059.1 acyl-CoA dehydrogenase [Sphingomonas sp. Root50]KRB94672.1 acyl-CoA dehydrogenase [Sphingomonas sp. Root720]
MNFDDTPEEAAFRARARTWIQQNAPHELAEELGQEGAARLTLKSVDPMTAARAWQKKKSDAGWATPHWPKEYGGADLSPIERVIWSQEEGVFASLSAPFFIGHGMCGPTLMAWGSDEDKKDRLPRLSSGEENWCQMFSEPAAGSDLAAVRTRAIRDGDDWVVNGQKIWTSYAHEADWGLLIARTDPTLPKHRGLTMFFLDMRSPGVVVQPIRQISDETEFNEIFLSDVRIPDAQRLGNIGQGWEVALTTLMNERASLATGAATGFGVALKFCSELEIALGKLAIDDSRVRSRLATFAIRDSGLRFTAFRNISALSRGERPGPESSISKLVWASTMQDVARFGMDLQGEAGLLDDSEQPSADGGFHGMLMRGAGMRIAGGTDEVMRNIIAERVLGLPADMRADKDVPFDQVPTSAR